MNSDFSKGLISLIIPVYNTEPYITSCLDSIFSQTYKKIEVIIVNNGSSGNINEIVEQYQEKYPDRTIKLIIHKENQGTFHGRGSGMAVAQGEYFTFMDADDRIGMTYFEAIIKRAQQSNAEIIMTDMVHEDENGYQFRYIEDPVLFMDIDIKGSENVFDFYYSYMGYSYSMYGIWNKLYKRTLWDRNQHFIESVDEHFALCEDAAYTTIFFSGAESVVNLHGQFYYHYVHSNASSSIDSLAGSKEKTERSIINQGTAFRMIKEHLKRSGLYGKYRKEFEAFRNFHGHVMFFNINISALNGTTKKNLTSFCQEQFEMDDQDLPTSKEMFYTSHFVEQTRFFEDAREDVLNKNTQNVFFEIFPVALLIDAWNEIDLLRFSEQQMVDEVPSYRMRIVAQMYAQQNRLNPMNGWECDTIEDIYNAIPTLYGIPKKHIALLQQQEKKTLLCSIIQRKSTKELYDIAVEAGKNIYFLADTAYDPEQIKELLESAGYTQYKDLYLSSQHGLTLESGSLLKTIAEDVGELNKSSVFFVGSYALHSSIQGDMKSKSYYMPKPTDELLNQTNGMYESGMAYASAYSRGADLSTDLWLRTQLAIAANRVFDNPFLRFHSETDYNGNPFLIGYLGLGMFANTAMLWLIKEVKAQKIKRIEFLGDECSIFEKVFKDLIAQKGMKIEIGINPVREITKPFPEIETKGDVRSILHYIDYTQITADELIEQYAFVLLDNYQNAFKVLCDENKLIPHKKLKSIQQLSALVLFLEEQFDEEKALKAQKDKSCNAVFITGLNMQVTHHLRRLPQSTTVFALFDANDDLAMVKSIFSRSYLTDEEKTLAFHFFAPCRSNFIGANSGLTLMHNGIMQYTCDMAACPLKVPNDLTVDAYQKPFFQLLRAAKRLDRYIFSEYDIEVLGITCGNLWDSITARYAIVPQQSSPSFPINVNAWPRIARWTYLLLVDRIEMKKRVRNKLQNHPRCLNVLQFGYNGVKSVKRKLTSKN